MNENRLNDSQKVNWTLIISVFGLVVSVVSLYFSIFSKRANLIPLEPKFKQDQCSNGPCVHVTPNFSNIGELSAEDIRVRIYGILSATTPTIKCVNFFDERFLNKAYPGKEMVGLFNGNLDSYTPGGITIIYHLEYYDFLLLRKKRYDEFLWFKYIIKPDGVVETYSLFQKEKETIPKDQLETCFKDDYMLLRELNNSSKKF